MKDCNCLTGMNETREISPIHIAFSWTPFRYHQSRISTRPSFASVALFRRYHNAFPLGQCLNPLQNTKNPNFSITKKPKKFKYQSNSTKTNPRLVRIKPIALECLPPSFLSIHRIVSIGLSYFLFHHLNWISWLIGNHLNRLRGL